MKTCSVCKQTKPLDEFNRKSSNKDGRERYCKPCHREYNKSHYNQNKEDYVASSTRNRKTKYLWWNEYKSQFKCNRCGEDKHWRISFHHLDPTQKDVEVSKLVAAASKKKLLEEITKCIPLCHNCHADVHYEIKNGSILC